MRAIRFMAATLLMLVMGISQAADQNAVVVKEMGVEAGPNGMQIVTGIAANQSQAVVKTVFLNFNLYDEQGVLVGNAATFGKNLGPGEAWRFRTTALPTPFSKAKITSIQVFDN